MGIVPETTPNRQDMAHLRHSIRIYICICGCISGSS